MKSKYSSKEHQNKLYPYKNNIYQQKYIKFNSDYNNNLYDIIYHLINLMHESKYYFILFVSHSLLYIILL